MLRCRPGPGITPGGRPGRRNVASVTHPWRVRRDQDCARHSRARPPGPLSPASTDTHAAAVPGDPPERSAHALPGVFSRSTPTLRQATNVGRRGTGRRPGDASAWQPTAPVIRSARTINATRSRTIQVLHPRYHVGRPLRGEYLASSASRQAPLLAPAAALACSHLSRASSPGLRSARLYQRRPAVARAAAPIARPANPSALPTAISTAATASSSRGRSCRDGSVRRDEVTMTCSHDSLSSDTRQTRRLRTLP